MNDTYSELDQSLWNRVISGEMAAFEEVVAKYQSIVVAVAFSQCGDFATSQDVAQETFLAAWISREQLREKDKLLGWLCSIARRLSAGKYRSQSKHAAVPFSEAIEPIDSVAEPIDSIISREEEVQVWDAIAELPPNYREPLVLFYQGARSVEQIASALETSIDAAKQRLSRGREMVRMSVLETLEDVLVRAQPNRSLTLRIMAAVAGFSGSSALASKGIASGFASSVTGAIAGKTVVGVAGGASAGLLGGLLGALGGLLGAYLGARLPALNAPTMTERRMLEKAAGVSMILAIIYTLAILSLSLGVVYQVLPIVPFALIFLVVQIAFFAILITQAFRVQRKVVQIRKSVREVDDPNPSAVRSWLKRKSKLYRGRCYQSPARFLGIPWIDIQVSDVLISEIPSDTVAKPKVACGWIAVGDRANGILLGIGGVARGLFAFGGLAYGGIAVGGVSIGLLGLGGAGVGAIACGGVALGMQAFGGFAVGWDVYGGCALGWHSAAGGGAYANHAAFGGLAIAKDFAIGGSGSAAEFNTPLAESVVQQVTYRWLIEYQAQHPILVVIGTICAAVVPGLLALLTLKLLYSREATST